MSIDPIRQHPPTAPGDSSTQVRRTRPSSPSPVPAEKPDSIALSPEAQQLQEARRQELLERIRQRLAHGFYSQPEVLRTVAERIADELTGSR